MLERFLKWFESSRFHARRNISYYDPKFIDSFNPFSPIFIGFRYPFARIISSPFLDRFVDTFDILTGRHYGNNSRIGILDILVFPLIAKLILSIPSMLIEINVEESLMNKGLQFVGSCLFFGLGLPIFGVLQAGRFLIGAVLTAILSPIIIMTHIISSSKIKAAEKKINQLIVFNYKTRKIEKLIKYRNILREKLFGLKMTKDNISSNQRSQYRFILNLCRYTTGVYDLEEINILLTKENIVALKAIFSINGFSHGVEEDERDTRREPFYRQRVLKYRREIIDYVAYFLDHANDDYLRYPYDKKIRFAFVSGLSTLANERSIDKKEEPSTLNIFNQSAIFDKNPLNLIFYYSGHATPNQTQIAKNMLQDSSIPITIPAPPRPIETNYRWLAVAGILTTTIVAAIFFAGMATGGASLAFTGVSGFMSCFPLGLSSLGAAGISALLTIPIIGSGMTYLMTEEEEEEPEEIPDYLKDYQPYVTVEPDYKPNYNSYYQAMYELRVKEKKKEKKPSSSSSSEIPSDSNSESKDAHKSPQLTRALSRESLFSEEKNIDKNSKRRKSVGDQSDGVLDFITPYSQSTTLSSFT